jgi:hypothetical protein
MVVTQPVKRKFAFFDDESVITHQSDLDRIFRRFLIANRPLPLEEIEVPLTGRMQWCLRNQGRRFAAFAASLCPWADVWWSFRSRKKK